MSDKEILKKAISKATTEGWEWNDIDNIWSDLGNKTQDTIIDMLIPNKGYNLFIYTHDFAKALWKDDEGDDKFQIHDNKLYEDEIYYWQHHLMQMVIADNPIKYLGDHI